MVSQSPYQNHLGIFLDAQLTFEEHLKLITAKVNKSNDVGTGNFPYFTRLLKKINQFTFPSTTNENFEL